MKKEEREERGQIDEEEKKKRIPVALSSQSAGFWILS